MPTHLLDTSVYSQPLKPLPDASAVTHWNKHGDPQVATASICEAEVLFGIAKKGSARLKASFTLDLRPRVVILPFDSACARAYADFRAACESNGTPVAEMDLLIAATAHANGLVLATLNVKDFSKIPGLVFEDWSTT